MSKRFREITIPGDVLDDGRLSDGAKIMYGKIARLSLTDGRCWAGNSFLDGTKSGRNASRLIAELRDSGYISIENERGKNRKIRVCPVHSKINPASPGEVEGHENADTANFGEAGEFENANPAKFGGVDETEGRANPASPGEVEGHEISNPASSGEVGKLESGNPASSGDRTVVVDIYNKTTTTPDSQKSNPEPPFSPEELKQALSALDRTLILRENFYPRAAAFMSEKGLDKDYLAWIYSRCEVKNPDSFDGYYFALFFAENMAGKYLAGRLPEAKPPPPPVTCPACGAAHAPDDGKCPSCGLPGDSPPERVLLYRELHGFPPDRRDEYLRREESLLSANPSMNFNELNKLKAMLAALKREFGLTAAS